MAKINFQKAPYRGVFSEIAKEQGVTPQAVRQAVLVYRNARIIKRLKEKIKERKDNAKYITEISSR